MKKRKEELTGLHKEKCKELKAIRARIAEDLGIDLKQQECTYAGYCSGTCPRCKQEELRLNAALLKKQMDEADIKRRVAAAGLTAVAAICLSGCTTDGNILNSIQTEDRQVDYPLDGMMEEPEDLMPYTEEAEAGL